MNEFWLCDKDLALRPTFSNQRHPSLPETYLEEAMAQGQMKKAKAPAPKVYLWIQLQIFGRSLTDGSTQRKQTGSRVIKPKKAALQKQHQMKKKHSSGLTDLTEKSLASKAGHLEILRGGKKDRKTDTAETKALKKAK